jgi:hypothetical protein
MIFFGAIIGSRGHFGALSWCFGFVYEEYAILYSNRNTLILKRKINLAWDLL